MPIFEYKCRKCGRKFEELVPASKQDGLACPSCGDADTERLISAAGILSSSVKAADACPSASSCASAGSSGCGGCCPMAG